MSKNQLPADAPNRPLWSFTQRVQDGKEPRIGYTPVSAGPLRVAEPERQIHAEPTEQAPIRRFTVFETETRLYILELEPTRRCMPQWTDGAMTRESVWRHAKTRRKTVVLPDGSEVQIFDEETADRAAYSFWVGVEASYSDAAYYAPLKFEAWCAVGKPDPYTNRPYTEKV